MVWVLETLASKPQDGRQDMGADGQHGCQMQEEKTTLRLTSVLKETTTKAGS